MSNALSVSLNLLLIALEQLMLYIMAEALIERRYKSIITALAFVACSIPMRLVLQLMPDSPLMKAAFSSTVLSAEVLAFFRTGIVKSLFSGVFMCAYLMLADTLLITVTSLILEVSVQTFLFGQYEYYSVCFFTKTVELFVIIAISAYLKRRFYARTIAVSSWMRTLIFPAASLIISLLLLSTIVAAPQATPQLLSCVVIVLLADVMSFFVLNQLDRQHEAIRDNAVLRHSIKLELDNIEAWKSAYSGQRKLTHDYHTQLSVIRGLTERGDRESLLAYLDGIQEQVSSAQMLVNTNRTAADIILNQKISLALSRNITFKHQLDDLTDIRLPDDELAIVLANVIDNAIEACEQIPEPCKRHIFLKLKTSGDTAFLYLENTTAHPVIIHNNMVLSSKETPLAHGFGLQNVASVLHRHGGLYSIRYEADRQSFVFSAQI